MPQPKSSPPKREPAKARSGLPGTGDAETRPPSYPVRVLVVLALSDGATRRSAELRAACAAVGRRVSTSLIAEACRACSERCQAVSPKKGHWRATPAGIAAAAGLHDEDLRGRLLAALGSDPDALVAVDEAAGDQVEEDASAGSQSPEAAPATSSEESPEVRGPRIHTGGPVAPPVFMPSPRDHGVVAEPQALGVLLRDPAGEVVIELHVFQGWRRMPIHHQDLLAGAIVRALQVLA